jgi:hypothetical protein
MGESAAIISTEELYLYLSIVLMVCTPISLRLYRSSTNGQVKQPLQSQSGPISPYKCQGCGEPLGWVDWYTHEQATGHRIDFVNADMR